MIDSRQEEGGLILNKLIDWRWVVLLDRLPTLMGHQMHVLLGGLPKCACGKHFQFYNSLALISVLQQ